ncbi:MAG TPA: hypothetical protein VFC26_03840 [Verrucomicrobiae bacterium]|nr:hypothetical protein [Verrucomicrobiae bacterium]
MKRSSDDEQRTSSPDEKLEAFFSGFLGRHPRFLIMASVALVVLIALAILVAKFAE